MDKERELICICCPRGCRLKVSQSLEVTGNFCPRGAIYGKQEVLSPERVITSTVKIDGAELPLCSAKSEKPIPKGLLFKAMEEINALSIKAPIKVGDILIKDLAGSGIPLVATSTLKKIN